MSNGRGPEPISAPAERPRARDLNILIGTMSPGPHNAITDVPGVRVGHVSLIRGSGKLIPGQGPVRTGVTAIRVEGDEAVAAAIHTINGIGYVTSAEIVREMGRLRGPVMLNGTRNVRVIADAVQDWSLRAIGPGVSPVVAECNDPFLNDIAGRHVHSEHVVQAIESGAGGPVAEGTVDAGVGMGCFGFKGGIGTASRSLPEEFGGFVVGVLVLSDFGGREGLREQLRIDGVPVGRELRDWPSPAERSAWTRAVSTALGRGRTETAGSIVMVLATNAPMDARQLRRLAVRCGAGLARTGSVYGSTSGDFVIAFSTTNRMPLDIYVRSLDLLTDAPPLMNQFFIAVADATEEAILNSLFRATTVVGRDDHVHWAIPIDEVVRIMHRYGRTEVRLPTG